MYVVYICGSSDLSNIINVIDLANFNHHLSCIAALHRRLYVQQVHTIYFEQNHDYSFVVVVIEQ